MDTYYERERFLEAKADDDEAVRHRKLELAEEATLRELEVGAQSGWLGGWGDSKTWLWIAFLIFVVFVLPAVLCIWLVGSGTQSHFHLGYPPTGPG